MSATIKQLQAAIIKFREARDWAQFHNPKDVALSLTLEAAEVVEHFQWKSAEEIEEYIETNKDEIAEELADVFYYVLLLCHDMNIDLVQALEDKMEKNEKRYPVDKSRGSAQKYTAYQDNDQE